MNFGFTEPNNVATTVAAHASIAAIVLQNAVAELKQARSLADLELHRAIAGFRQIFTTVPVEMRSNVLLKQAWAVHQALEMVRSLDAALIHLAHEHRAPVAKQKLAA